jgi:hypothetical protein
MVELSLEEEKDALIQTITDAYARGSMDMPAFERAVTRISASADRDVLASEAAALGLSSPTPRAQPPVQSSSGLESAADAVELTCVSGRIRKTGEWVNGSLYKLSLKSSSVRLDLREYEGVPGFRLVVDLDAISSSVRLIVPEGFEVEDRFSENSSSSVRNRLRGDVYGDNRVLLTGRIRSSVVKVKYR